MTYCIIDSHDRIFEGGFFNREIAEQYCEDYNDAEIWREIQSDCGYKAQTYRVVSQVDGKPDLSDDDDYGDGDDYSEPEDTMSDMEADADTLRMAGWGTDEDYGYFGGED